MPVTAIAQQLAMRTVYRICPLEKMGHATFATNAGAMLQKAMIPLGVDGGSKSRAADSMITYRTLLMRPKVKKEKEWRKRR
jgi:hypothetical protein